jgi:hypothetical protein
VSDPKPPHPAPGALLGLQAAAGNRAVSALVATRTGVVQRSTVVQREPSTEQKKEFDGYVNQGDWGRAAWVLNGWDVDDIDARLKRNLSPAQLERLAEGAWFSGKDNVDDAVRKRDPLARAKGAIRVLAPRKRWDEAAKVLGAVPHRTAMTYVKDLAAKARADQRRPAGTDEDRPQPAPAARGHADRRRNGVRRLRGRDPGRR